MDNANILKTTYIQILKELADKEVKEVWLNFSIFIPFLVE